MNLNQLSEGKLETSYPNMEAVLSDRDLAAFRELLGLAQNYFDEGELIKSEFARLKYINRYIEKTVHDAYSRKYTHSGKYEDLPDHIRHDLDTLNIGMHTIPGKLKKALALQKKGDHPSVQKYIELMNEFMPLHLMQKELKGMIVAKKAAAVQKQADVETKDKFRAGHKDVKKIQKVLTQVTQELADKVLKSNIEYCNQVVEKFWEQYDPEDDRNTGNYHVNAQNPFWREIVQLSIAPNQSWLVGTPEKRDPKTKQRVQKYAQRMTDDILSLFISKNTAKLADIVIKKNNMNKIELHGARTGSGVVEGLLKLKFADGSSFNVNNKVVWSISKLGKVFHRFPTTFHQVVMPDGTRMKGAASEARMNDEFAAV